MTTPTAQRPMRRDARTRRAALVAAAAECFDEHGYGVPLEIVLERAGVGRGTLYRNFKDREALALAIFADEVDRLEAIIRVDEPIDQILGTIVHDGARASGLFARIASEFKLDDDNVAGLRALGHRLEAMLAPSVARAHERGELRSDVGPEQIVTIIRMMGALALPVVDGDQVERDIRIALALVFDGLRPRVA